MSLEESLPSEANASVAPKGLSVIVIIVSFIALLVVSGFVIKSASEPFLTDHIESQIASVSTLAINGHAVYNDFDDTERYSLVYGPMLYYLYGVIMKVFGFSTVVLKYAVGLIVLAALPLFYLSTRRQGADVTVSAGLFSVSLFLWLTNKPFISLITSVRTEPLLLFFIILAYFGATLPNRRVSAAMAIISTAMVFNIKIHSVLYLFPLYTFFFLRQGKRYTAVLTGLAAMCCFLPFALHEVSLINFIKWLKMTSHHGTESFHIPKNIRWAAFVMSIPVVSLFVAGYRESRKEAILLVVVLALSIAPIVYIAAKKGSGPHHILMFTPAMAFVTATVLSQGVRWDWLARKRLLMIALILVLMAGAGAASYKIYRNLDSIASASNSIRVRSSESIDEMREFSRRFQGHTIAMGYGGDYGLTNNRAELVYLGNPYLIDSASLMDSDLGGVGLSEKTYQAIRDCSIDIWILPKTDRPFFMYGLYKPEELLFSEDFIKEFSGSYRKTASGKFYDVWQCSKKTP